MAKCLPGNISATMRDRGVVSMDHFQETKVNSAFHPSRVGKSACLAV